MPDRDARGMHAMAEGDAAYAMAIESAAIAFAACDRRLGPQLSEAFSEALELRGAAVAGGLYRKSAVIDVLDDVFARVVALYAEDLVPAREHVLRERAEMLLRKILAEISTDCLVEWPFPEPNGDTVD
jgi:hypothetical protein